MHNLELAYWSNAPLIMSSAITFISLVSRAPRRVIDVPVMRTAARLTALLIMSFASVYQPGALCPCETSDFEFCLSPTLAHSDSTLLKSLGLSRLHQGFSLISEIHGRRIYVCVSYITMKITDWNRQKHTHASDYE